MQNYVLLKGFILKFWPWILGTALIASIIWVFFIGYRVGLDPIVYRNGAVTIQNLPLGSTIYVDQARRKVRAHDTYTLHLSEGAHDVIVDTPNNQPWNELVVVKKNQTTTVTPILVPRDPKTKELNTKQLGLLGSALSRTPTQAEPLVLEGACVQVYISGNRVIAAPGSDCTPPSFMCSSTSCDPTIIFSAKDRLRSVLRYKGRTDAVIVSAGPSVYVIELDPHTPQFFAPLYTGIAPRVTSIQTNVITIIDGDKALALSL